MKDILRKASKIEFDIPTGDCVIMTLCLTKYMKEKYDIELTAHIGALVSKKGITLHMWNTYEGKIIDLTAHKQQHDKGQSLILGEPISGKGNSKRVISYKIDSERVRAFARKVISDAAKTDTDAVTDAHIFLNNERTGKLPYDEVITILGTKQNGYWQHFISQMEKQSK